MDYLKGQNASHTEARVRGDTLEEGDLVTGQLHPFKTCKGYMYS